MLSPRAQEGMRKAGWVVGKRMDGGERGALTGEAGEEGRAEKARKKRGMGNEEERKEMNGSR